MSTKTLRFYEHAGLLAPPTRTSNGYRDYEDSALDRLAFIRASQAAGLTLAEIGNIIAIREEGVAPCSHVVQLLDTKAEAVSRQIAELRHLKRELDRLRKHATAVDPAVCPPSGICEVLLPTE